MRELISLHVGNAGVSLGDQCWELFSLEHGIGIDGKLRSNDGADAFQTHYSSFRERYHPRAVFIDLDPTRIEEVQTSRLNRLYSRDTSFVKGLEGSSSIFSLGYISRTSTFMEQIEESVRKQVEDCTGLQGFFLYHNLSGGTGGGTSTRILETFSDEYGKKSKLTITMFPSLRNMYSVLEPYNVILSLHCLLEHVDNTVCISNDALIRKSQEITSRYKPSYQDLNNLTKVFVSSMTTSLRFDGALNCDITEFQTGLVPYPRIHFLQAGFSPFVPPDEDNKPMTTSEITKSCLLHEGNLSNIDPRDGKYMSCCLMYRGDTVARDINSAVANIKQKEDYVKFVDWSPTGFKCGLNPQPPISVDGDGLGKMVRSVTSLSSNTAIGDHLILPFYEKAQKMFNKKAYLHWIVGNGGKSVEEEDIRDAFEDVRNLMLDYEEVGAESIEDYEEEEEEEGEEI